MTGTVDPSPAHRIWLVDDDPDVGMFVRLMLERAGVDHALTLHASCETARDGLATHEGPAPDLVLLDQVLPDGTGSSLFAEIDAAFPEAIVRVITAAPDELDEVTRSRGVIAKPPQGSVLLALLGIDRPAR